MVSSRLTSGKILSPLLLAAVAVLTLDCGGGDSGGGVTPPADPTIALSSSTVNFTSTAGAPAPAPQTITIANSGGGTLDGLEASVSYTAGQAAGWLTAVLSATEVPSTLILNAAPGSLAPATYTANVAITSSAASNSPQTLAVTLTVAPAAGGGPLIALSSVSQTFTAVAGEANPAAQTVQLTNGGGGTLDGLTATVTYTAGQPAGWLNAALSSPAAPSTLTLGAATGSLAAGAYTASVAVASPSATNSPQTVNVTFTVTAAGGGTPTIKLSTDNRSFTATEGGSDPATKTVQVTNSGAGTLSGLSATVAYTAGQPTGWLAANLSATQAPSTIALAVTVGTLTAGTYTAAVAVAAPSAGNTPQTVTVSLVVTPPAGSPSITLTPSAVDFSVTEGGADPAAKTIAVTNGGSGSLGGLALGTITYGAGASGWLVATLAATTAPTTLTLQATTSTLSSGTYTATVPVTSSVSGVSPQTISVSLLVSSSSPATGILAASVVAAANGVANSPCNLYVVEVAPNGIDVLRGRIKTASGFEPVITDLALSPGGKLYGISFTTLYTIDQTTGAATEVGSLGLAENANALAFDGNSKLFAATAPGKLYEVNVTSGEATEIGSYGNDVQSGGDIVFVGTTLYGAAVTQDSKSVLVTIDPGNGAATVVDPTNSFGYDGIWGLAYFGGQLYGLTSEPTSATGLLLEINVTTGAAGFVRDLDFDTGGAAAARP